MRDTYRSGDNTRLWKIVLRAFGYDPIDASVAIMQGRITYAEFVMDKTPSGKLASISGTIVNEQNEPIDGARISLSFPFAYNVRNDEPRISMNTGSDGQYSFENLSTTEYDIVVLAPGYASISNHVILSAGKTIIKNIKLYYNWNIIIDYVYQADGSRNFTGGNLQTGTIEWINGTGGADFSDGKVEQYEPNSLRDIEMIQGQGDLEFRIVYVNGKNGFYDAGDAAFESVTEAAESGYSGKGKPCVVGHVYIVRTYEDKYAKFVVRDILESK